MSVKESVYLIQNSLDFHKLKLVLYEMYFQNSPIRAAFQLSVFYTYVHVRKSLNSSKQFVFNK